MQRLAMRSGRLMMASSYACRSRFTGTPLSPVALDGELCMRTRILGFILGCFAVCGLAISTPTAELAAEVKIDAGDYKILVDHDLKILASYIAKPDPKAYPTMKATALMIAYYAQTAGDGPTRDAAVALAEAVASEDAAKVKTAYEALAKLKPTPGKVAAVELVRKAKFELHDLMDVFRLNRGKGGTNLEKEIRDNAKKVTDYNKVTVIGLKTALIGEWAQTLTPSAFGGKQTKESWMRLSKEMQTISEEVAGLAKGGKANEVKLKAALKKLDANCTECHNIFRE